MTADVVGYSRLMAAARTAGALSLALNVRYWPECEVPTGSRNVCCLG